MIPNCKLLRIAIYEGDEEALPRIALLRAVLEHLSAVFLGFPCRFEVHGRLWEPVMHVLSLLVL